MRNKIIQIAQNEIGYKEYANKKTKYGDWFGMNDEWCNIFVSWVCNQAGVSTEIVPKQSYVPTTYQWFNSKGKFKKRGTYTPQKADIILFDYNQNGTPDHIGFVEKVENGIVTTIEGNKSKQVMRCTYNLNNVGIFGYCTPAYIEEKPEPQPTYSYKQFVGDVQASIGAKKDFVAGAETLSKTVTVSRYKNSRHAVVKAIQKYLYFLGYTEVGESDGIAGIKFDKGMKRFQKEHGCVVDGEATAKCLTWKKRLKLA